MLLAEAQCVVRVYMISGYDFASRDVGGFSDPYLILRIGTKKISESKNYQLDEPNPVFNKYYDFESTFPGCPMLEIRAMDYDMLFGDELIGNTTMDLEDRFFLPEWNAIKDKPVEYR
jgi:Ca2+-dependent lipid-binding protein